MHKIKLLIITAALTFLTACQPNVVIEVDLTEERRAEILEDIRIHEDLIKNYDPKDPSTLEPPKIENVPIDVPEGATIDGMEIEGATVEFEQILDDRPPFQWFLSIGNGYQQLGELTKALKTYDRALRHYETSRIAWHNKGRIYELMNEYDKAVVEYERILDVFNLHQYHKDIADAYIRKGDPEAAQKAYDQYRILTNQTDQVVEQLIKRLREIRAEEANAN